MLHVVLILLQFIPFTDSLFPPALPLPPKDLPAPILPVFGPNAGSIPQGSRVSKGGKYNYPFYKFNIGTIMSSPAFQGCCRVCPEQFGLEIGLLLEVNARHKRKNGKRTTKGGDAVAGLADTAAGSKGGAPAKAGTTSTTPKAGATSATPKAGATSSAKSGSSSKADSKVGGGGGAQAPIPPPKLPSAPIRDHTADASSMGSTNIGFGLLGRSPTHGGISGFSTNGFVSGPQMEAMLPCCKVCKEQFLMPHSLEDVSTSFIETKEKESIKSTTKDKKGFVSSKKMAGMRQFTNGPTTMDTRYNSNGECCNLCDKQTMKPSSSLKLPFSFLEAMEVRKMNHDLARRKKNGFRNTKKSSPSVFLEQNQRRNGVRHHRRKGFVGSLGALGAMAGAAMGGLGGGGHVGANNGCCPVCPNLQTILNAGVPQDEAFGGPFAAAMESKEQGAPLTSEEKKALEEIADQAGVDEAQARRDPGMTRSARARAASGLGEGAAALAGGAMGAASSLMRI
jgi:hypothetical protein